MLASYGAAAEAHRVCLVAGGIRRLCQLVQVAHACLSHLLHPLHRKAALRVCMNLILFIMIIQCNIQHTQETASELTSFAIPLVYIQ